MAKKDPYKNIQKRFVQARAGDVEFDDISLEDRERFQTRFADLAQTQEGRSKIAQRVLPTATPEQRAQLKQRVRKNLPSSGVGDVEIDMTEEEPKAGPAPQRLLPTSANIRDMQSGFRMQGTAIEKRRASAPSTTTRETTTKSKVSTSDRIGTGFFSVPKNPLSAAKEFVSGITTTGRDIADIGARGYVNPVINIVARGTDVVGGRTGTQKFKPLPQLSNREIGLESALTVGTGGVGAVLRPFLRPTGAALGAIARQIGGRAPGTGAALANISKRQSNLTAVRQASALSEVGARAAAERIAALGSDVGTGTVPKSSGAKFLTPKTTGVTARPVAPRVKAAPKTKATPKAKAAPKAKAVVVQAAKAAPVVAQAAAPRAAVKAAAAPKVASAPATSTSSKFPTTKQIETTANLRAGTGESASVEVFDTKVKRSAGVNFFEEFGEIEMRSTEYRAMPAGKAPAPAAAPKPAAAAAPKAAPAPKASTRASRPMIDKVDITEAWVRSGGTAKTAPKPSNVSKIKSPPKAKQKKNQVSSPVAQKQQLDESYDALDLQIAKDYPYSSTARYVYQARRGSGRSTGRPSERMVIEPRQSTTVPVIEESISDKMVRAIRAEPKKQTGPDWNPRKVTKLPKVDRSATPDSMLFRMYDKGKRPKRSGTDYAIGQPMDVDIGTSPTRFYETTIPAGTAKSLEKEIQETIFVPESTIRKGEAINVRSRRRASTAKADGAPPTSKSLQAEGEPRTVPTEIPSIDAGLSSEQRRQKFYREAFPQARSTRQARKLYEESMGRADTITTIGEFGKTGSPLGARAKKTPLTTVSVPTKYVDVINPKTGEVGKRPVAFKSVPAVETAAGPVELSKAPELKPYLTKEQERASRKKFKAEKLSSQAGQAARLRNKGISGDRARSKYDEIQRIKAEGKKFQRRYDIS